MSSKDNALFEVRKHNDFSVLCSDDEESTQIKTETVEASTVNTEALRSQAAAEASAAEDDGFETFTTVRKVKRVTQPKPATGAFGSRPASGAKPKEIVVPKAENSIELYEFPSTLKTNDLRKFLQEFDGHYRLKWINDTSCYVVFDDESLVERALNELKDENIKVKNYVEPIVTESTETTE